MEARYADAAFARRIYAGLVDDLLANGTTTALYFATIHLQSTIALAEICLEKGQRALIGRIAPGCRFDALLVDTEVADSNLRLFRDFDSPEDVFRKIVYNAGRANIRKVWVEGRLVVDKTGGAGT